MSASPIFLALGMERPLTLSEGASPSGLVGPPKEYNSFLSTLNSLAGIGMCRGVIGQSSSFRRRL